MRYARLFLTVVGVFLFTQTGRAAIDTVKVQDFSFVPSSLTVHPGDTVVWKVTQECCIAHTTTRSTAPMTWNSGPLALNQTFQQVFNQTGTFSYFCSAHAGIGMVGSITVISTIPSLGWLGLALLLASLAVAAVWILERKRKTV